jgi:serine/threonine protein kinase
MTRPGGAKLVVKAGPTDERTVSLSAAQTIGRASDNDICVSDPAVELRHAKIVLNDDGRFLFRDLGGPTGSFLVRSTAQDVLRIRVTEHVLSHGDAVYVGRTRLSFADPLGLIPASLRDRFSVVRELDETGEYLGSDPSTGAPLRLVCLNHPMSERYLRGLEVLSQIGSPWVARVYGGGVCGDVSWTATELVTAPRLSILARDRRWSLAEVVSILTPISEALTALHEATHHLWSRATLTPHIIRIDTALKVKIELIGALGLATQSLEATLPYSAPERLDGKNVDHRADLWALAVIAFELLAGAPLWRGAVPEMLRRMVLRSPPPRLVTAEVRRPEYLDAFFSRALAREPAERPQTAALFMRELERAIAESAPRR